MLEPEACANIVSTLRSLLSVVKAWDPVESWIISDPAPPSIVSLFPSPALRIFIVSAFPPPLMLSYCNVERLCLIS